jgi:3-methyladenine DNA glycosylase AlkD
MKTSEILETLQKNRDSVKVEGMEQFGILGKDMLGIPIPFLRKLAKEIGINHTLAQKLWDSGLHEARILASMIDNPSLVTIHQMEMWVRDFDSWDLCDQVCMNLFDKTPFAYEKAIQWSYQGLEFIKRAGFALMATLAVHDKSANDEIFFPFLARILDEAEDSRNFVKKAINWALRQIGKRNHILKQKALETAVEMLKNPSKSAKWIANDAIRELNEKVFPV